MRSILFWLPVLRQPKIPTADTVTNTNTIRPTHGLQVPSHHLYYDHHPCFHRLQTPTTLILHSAKLRQVTFTHRHLLIKGMSVHGHESCYYYVHCDVFSYTLWFYTGHLPSVVKICRWIWAWCEQGLSFLFHMKWVAYIAGWIIDQQLIESGTGCGCGYLLACECWYLLASGYGMRLAQFSHVRVSCILQATHYTSGKAETNSCQILMRDQLASSSFQRLPFGVVE